jgi:hypothetical protein
MFKNLKQFLYDIGGFMNLVLVMSFILVATFVKVVFGKLGPKPSS